jgi:hypothetical protein
MRINLINNCNRTWGMRHDWGHIFIDLRSQKNWHDSVKWAHQPQIIYYRNVNYWESKDKSFDIVLRRLAETGP